MGASISVRGKRSTSARASSRRSVKYSAAVSKPGVVLSVMGHPCVLAVVNHVTLIAMRGRHKGQARGACQNGKNEGLSGLFRLF